MYPRRVNVQSVMDERFRGTQRRVSVPTGHDQEQEYERRHGQRRPDEPGRAGEHRCRPVAVVGHVGACLGRPDTCRAIAQKGERSSICCTWRSPSSVHSGATGSWAM